MNQEAYLDNPVDREQSGTDAPMFTLLPGQILKDTISNSRFRVLYVSEAGNGDAYWIDLDKSTNIPRPFDIRTVRSLILEGVYLLLPDTAAISYIDETGLSDSSKKIRDTRYGYIRDIAKQEPDIYLKGKRTNLLVSAQNRFGIKKEVLYGYLGKYWKGGKVKNALLPDYQNCGRAREVGIPQTSLIGRHTRDGNNRKLLNDHDYKLFAKWASAYKKEKKLTLKNVYDDMIEIDYLGPVSPKDGKPTQLPPDQKPSYRQFYYWYSKNTDVVETTKSKEGQRKFNLEHRSALGRCETYVIGPGFAVQIDAMIGDFYLVMKQSREKIIGRPVIYLAKDVMSRETMGVHITLESPSWKQALMAIKNCAEDKVEFCKRFGVDITHEDWPVSCLPSVLVADNGELGGSGVEDIIAALGITVENCPSYRGDLKPIVEKANDVLQCKLRPITPGYIEKDSGTRGAEDYRKTACVDYYSFCNIFIRFLLFENNSHYMDNYIKTPHMRELGVRPIPIELWRYGTKYCSGAHRTVTSDEIYRILLPRDTAQVTEYGIKYKGIYYTCMQAEEDKWFEHARIKGNYYVTISYDPTSVQHIYIHPDDGPLITCNVLDKNRAYEKFTPEQIEQFREDDLNEKAAHAQEEEWAKGEVKRMAAELIKRCKDEKAGAAKIKEALTRHSINDNRDKEWDQITGAAEARKMQADEGISTPLETNNNSPTDKADENPVVSAMDRAIDEALKKAGLD